MPVNLLHLTQQLQGMGIQTQYVDNFLWLRFVMSVSVGGVYWPITNASSFNRSWY